MSYCIYLRKSRSDDVENGSSNSGGSEVEVLQRHEKALLELARRQRLEIGAIYREVVSGETIAARPVMQQLLTQVEQGMWEGVLVMEVERLARGETIDQGIVAQTFKYSGTLIVTPLKTFDPENEYDEEYFEFGLFMSRREYKTINRRLQRGRVASVKEGKYVCSKRPYGYERVRLTDDTGFTLRAIPSEAEVVKYIYRLYTEGEDSDGDGAGRIGISRITNRLNELGLKPMHGDHWTLSSVRDILINPVYIGYLKWNWRPVKKKIVDGRIVITRPRAKESEYTLVKGLHEAIIDNETFDIAKHIMASHKKKPIGEHLKVMNPLLGLIQCGYCGKIMQRRPYGDRQTEDTLMCQDPACCCVSSKLRYVEERLLKGLEEWLQKYKLSWEKEEKKRAAEAMQEQTAGVVNAMIKKLAADRETLLTQIDRTHDLLEQGIYTSEEFIERSRKLSEKLKANEKELADTEAAAAAANEREISYKMIIPKVERLLEVYNNLPSAEAKNNMLSDVIEKAVYKKAVRGTRKNKKEDEFELTLYPLIPSTDNEVLSSENK